MRTDNFVSKASTVNDFLLYIIYPPCQMQNFGGNAVNARMRSIKKEKVGGWDIKREITFVTRLYDSTTNDHCNFRLRFHRRIQ